MRQDEEEDEEEEREEKMFCFITTDKESYGKQIGDKKQVKSR